MKLSELVTIKIPKGILFADRIGGYSLLGDGRANTKVPLLNPNKNALSQFVTEFCEHTVLIPLGYREFGSARETRRKGFKGAPCKVRYDKSLGMFCLLIDTRETNPECVFGLSPLEIAEIPMLMQMSHLCDGNHSFDFVRVEVERDQEDDFSFGTPVAKNSFAALTNPVHPNKRVRLEYERITNLEREAGTLALWTALGRPKDHLDALFVRGKAGGSLLTREQYQALVSFVRLFCTVEYSLDFYGFVPAVEDHKKVMATLATIDHPIIKEWFELYINELLLHEMMEVRTIMKYYVDATAEEA